MERRFRVRLAQLLEDAHVPPNLLRGILPRLQTFLQPFLDTLQTSSQLTNAHHYVQGLLSDLGSKDRPFGLDRRGFPERGRGIARRA
jgi:hypothetical protein